MSEKVELSRQQRKSQETREKIFQAAKKILQKKGRSFQWQLLSSFQDKR